MVQKDKGLTVGELVLVIATFLIIFSVWSKIKDKQMNKDLKTSLNRSKSRIAKHFTPKSKNNFTSLSAFSTGSALSTLATLKLTFIKSSNESTI